MTSKIRELGHGLSSMVMPNIGAFMTWGIITAFFSDFGWIPNKDLAKLINPFIVYLLPLLIAYTGGKMIGGSRGGVVGAVGTLGLIVGSEIPMFIGAMVMGPLGGYLIHLTDNRMKDKMPTGFEMLISNFSAGLIGVGLILFSYKVIGPLVVALNLFLQLGVAFVVKRGLLFLSAIFIEPGKILFLNNALNHGILSPLGVQDTLLKGKSIFFLLETNPGPGLGILLAYFVYSKGEIKNTIPSAIIIHALGGIHEIYFPYVLMRPLLIFPVILGGLASDFVFQIMDAGLVATPSPGSLFAILAMTPKSGFLPVIFGIVSGIVISYIGAGIILKKEKNWTVDALDESRPKDLFDGYTGDFKIKKITFACDAGMGSSAMGASIVTGILKKYNINIPVENKSIENLDMYSDLVITFEKLMPKAEKMTPNALHVSVKNFIDREFYENMILELLECCEFMEVTMEKQEANEILLLENIILNQPSVSKEAAILKAGQLLFESGYVGEPYIQGMLAREEKFSTYIGNQVAIPHGENEVKSEVKTSGIVVFQYPDGVDFGENKTANLIIGIAGKGNEHIKILANIAEAIEDEETLRQLLTTQDPHFVYELLSQEEF